MKINNLKIAKFLSFGPEQDLKNFSYFNLFIGKNGSGKTNTFKILQGLDVDYEILKNINYEDIKVKVTIPNINGSPPENKEIDVYVPSMIMQQHINRESLSSEIYGNLEIEYEIKNNGQIENKKIKFSDDSRRIIRFNEGDINILKRGVKLIELPKNEAEFYKDLVLFFGGRGKAWLPYLNFALFYIFGLHYRFSEDGTFIQAKHSSGGIIEENTISLPSGALNCAKIITKYLMTLGKDTILIDEPELHLEPRILRNLFQFLVWINIKDKTDKTIEEKIIFDSVEAVIKLNTFKESSTSTWAIIESTNDTKTTYHDINSVLPQSQIFIASHSSALINEFIKLGNESRIYEFDSAILNFNQLQPTGNFNSDMTLEEKKIPLKGLFSTVRNVSNNNVHNILDNLGCKGSDLLQTNGIIWVEGPSDVVYIKKWLELYCNENNFPQVIQGKDYEFQMFGGTLLDSLCLIKSERNLEEEEYKKLVSMFSFSKNAFVVIDSDSILNADKKIIDKSKFKKAKKYIKDQIETLQKENLSLGMWYKEGKTEIRTIESYLDNASIKFKSKKNWTKKIAAQKITESWKTTKKLSEFKNDLNGEIEILYKTIKKWNN